MSSTRGSRLQRNVGGALVVAQFDAALVDARQLEGGARREFDLVATLELHFLLGGELDLSRPVLAVVEDFAERDLAFGLGGGVLGREAEGQHGGGKESDEGFHGNPFRGVRFCLDAFVP